MKVKSRINPSADPSWIEDDKEYVVLSIEEMSSKQYLRLLSEQNETPALFLASDFEVTSSEIPSVWSVSISEDGSCIELIPALWRVDGFWEGYFDGDVDAKIVFDKVVEDIMSES